MNLYRCISEEMSGVDPILHDGSGPIEHYRIAVLIAAETRSKAKWAAWRTDPDAHFGVIDMPRFSVRCARKDVDVPAGDYSDDPRFRACWDIPDPGRCA